MRNKTRDRKRTTIRDAERAMQPVLDAITARRIGHEADTVLRQAYLDDPYSGAYDLPMLAELAGVPVLMLDGES